MTRPHSISTLLILSTFGCVIDPGVLEGGDDELGDEVEATGETDTAGETGDALLAECLRGTNPAGGSEPEDFPVEACEMTCDQGWGHGSSAIPIEWTLTFETNESDTYLPLGVFARSNGDGVVVVAERPEKNIELVTVSSQGVVLDITTQPISAQVQEIDAAEGVIFFAYHGAKTWEVRAIDELGTLLWSIPWPTGHVDALAAVPGGGVIIGEYAYDPEGGGAAPLTRLNGDGEFVWTTPNVRAQSIEVSASGDIVVGGYVGEPDPEQTMLVRYSALGEPIEFINLPGGSEQLWDLHFLAEQRVFATGTHYDPIPSNASVQVIDLDDPELGWTREYNRALDSCDDEGTLVEQPTWDWFGDSAMLTDGSFLITGAETGPALPPDFPDGSSNIQPWVAHVDQQGEFLASDRGLWFGQAKAVAAGDDGSAYVAMTMTPSRGFHLRKYQP